MTHLHPSSRVRSAPCKFRRAVTLVECVMAIAVFSVGAAASLRAAGAAMRTAATASRSGAGALLADALLTEVLQHPYSPAAAASGASVGAGVSVLGGSVALGGSIPQLLPAAATIDDYNNYADPKPVDAAGIPVTTKFGYTRKVTVQYVTLASPSVVTGIDQGLKRITITVTYNAIPVAQRTALKGNLSGT
ncbi:hypothetical protein BH11PLA1_BH11PLA1_09980 [soil metagenome]